jgi:hypothetical protein
VTVVVSGWARAAVHLRAGRAHLENLALELAAVEGDDRLFGFGVIGHLDKREPSYQPRPPVGHHFETLNRSMTDKYGSNLIFGNARTEVSDANVVHLTFSFRA